MLELWMASRSIMAKTHSRIEESVTNTIDIKGFTGANSVKKEEGFWAKAGIAEPRVILNADVDIMGRLVKRKGKTLFITMAGAHSLWANDMAMSDVWAHFPVGRFKGNAIKL